MGILSRLGGVSASSPQQATHLVMPQLRRTDNLLLCLPRSVSISTGPFQANNLNSRNQERCVDSPCTFSVSNLCWPPPGWRKVDLQTGWSPVFFTACLAVIIISNFISLVFFWLDFWFLLTGRKMGKCWRCRWCKTFLFSNKSLQTSFKAASSLKRDQTSPRSKK